MNYDVTFCSNTKCTQDCKRNQKNISEEEIKIRQIICICDMPDFKYFNKERCL